MKFSITAFLKKMAYQPEQQAFFANFQVTEVLYYRKKERIILKIENKRILPYALYADLKAYLEGLLNHELELYFKTEAEEIALCDLNAYLEAYSNTHQPFFQNALFTLNEQQLAITYAQLSDYQKDADKFADLKLYFLNCGLNKPIDFKVKTAQTEEMKTVELPVKVKEITPAKRSNTKKIKKEDYQPVKIDELSEEREHVVIEAIIFKCETITTKNNRLIQTLYLKDEDNACIAKLFESGAFTTEDLRLNTEGKKAKFYGDYRFDSYTNDYLFFPDALTFVDYKRELSDDAPDKRIELHAHTNKSEMDGVCDASEIVTAAFKMGHEAVAITDHYVVQAFPSAQRTAAKLLKEYPERKFKVLYGCEFSMVDEKLEIVYNERPEVYLDEAEYVVFDLETTGLSAEYDHIIEFGAVLMYRGMIKERKDLLIKPPVALDSFISKLTHIEESDLSNAPSFAQAKDEILAFIKDRILVAHNASFDYGFLNAELKRIGCAPLDNPVIDTLDLSRLMFNRRSYRLGNIAKYYNVAYDESVAHRADYDAQVLASIFNLMLHELKDKQYYTLTDLNARQDAQVYTKKPAYHTNVLARNKAGLKDLFKLVSIAHTETLAVFSKASAKAAEIAAEPRIFRSTLNKMRQNLLIGSGCLNGEIFELAQTRSQATLEKAMAFYDYIEVQPLENYRHLVEYRHSLSQERLKTIIRKIISTAKKLNKPIAASGDLHYVFPDEKILRDVYINALAIGGAHHPLYIYDKEKRATAKMPDQHFLNTKEMLTAFAWLNDEKLINELVVTNPKKISDLCEVIRPIHDKLYTPHIAGSDEKLKAICYKTAYEKYGNPLDPLIKERLERELAAIIGNGYGVIYYVSHLLVKKSNEDGYLVGSRGSVGSSLVATMSGITEVNPLPPHYLCPHCKHLEWVDPLSYPSGYNLPDKRCPVCGEMMQGDGQDIPFETFLGFHGDKVPDIDLNFSGEYQAKAHLFTREVFGEDKVFRAGTIGTVAEKTAFGYVSGYCEELGLPPFNRAQRQRLASGCEGVKRTTGQHPGGIIVIPEKMDVYDFTPVQYPANDPSSAWRTTHFDFHEIHDNVLKFDILGHVDPTAMRLLENISGVDPKSIPMNDPQVMSLFYSPKALKIINPHYHEETGAAGLPEFGTSFVRGILELTRPHTFSELVQISGLSHGTNVWNNNAKDLIESGISLKDVIGCRDDIMSTLIHYGLPSKDAFDIMEKVRKGKGLSTEESELMLAHDVPPWYIDSCKKIKYMFPKAHAVAYVIMAMRIAWFKVYYPEYYYVSFFSLRCDAYDIAIMSQDAETIRNKLDYLYAKIKTKDKTQAASKKEKDLYDTLEICYEMVSRGYRLLNIDIERSLAAEFRVNPDNHHEIIPPFKILDGLGDNVAESIVKAREERPFISKQDLMNRTLLSSTLCRTLDNLGILKDLSDTNQMTLF